jgi:hypothetical protein
MGREIIQRLNLPEKTSISDDDIIVIITDVSTVPKLKKMQASNLLAGATGMGGGIPSSPPQGNYKVKNIYVDSQTGKLVIEYET